MPLQGTTLHGYTFVGCPRRFGHINKTGPVTGTPYEITPTGVWIDEDDAFELTADPEWVFCVRTMGNILEYTVFGLNADVDQCRQLEEKLAREK